MRRSLLLSLLVVCSIVLFAKERTQQEARAIAKEYFYRSASVSTRAVPDPQLAAVSNDLLKSAVTRSKVAGAPAFYVYNNGDAGYVIVSGDDRMKPVLGYSDNGVFVTENIPDNMLGWLTTYAKEMAALGPAEMPLKLLVQKESATFSETVAPLLKNINWNQDAPYYNACPKYQGALSVTGCVATAMAMIMKYHNYPIQGKGKHSYTTKNLQLACSFDFGNTTFDWNNMLPEYVKGAYNDVQANAVAQLMYACGVSVDMEYSPDASGAIAAKTANALVNYFNYDKNLQFVSRDYFSYSEWMGMIKKELSEGRPVLYNGASEDVGHEFVFDGYDAQDMVHVNWGWGGSNNGYFEVSSLNPSSPGIGGGTNMGGGFVYNQGMIVGFQKPTDTSKYMSRFYCEEIQLDKMEFQKGDAFTATISRLFNMSTTFKGAFGLVLENEGKQTVLSTYKQGEEISTNYGFSKLPWNEIDPQLSFPTNLPDGDYVLYLATKADGKEDVWSKVLGVMGANCQYYVYARGNQIQIAPYWGDLEVNGTVEILHNLYSGKTGDFTLRFSNPNQAREYYGQVGVAFVQGGEYVTTVGAKQLLLKNGEQGKTVNVSDALKGIAAGEYEIFPAVSWGPYLYAIGQSTNVEVKGIYGSSTLKAVSLKLAKNSVAEGEDVAITGILEATGTSPVYDAKLMAAVFATGASSTSSLFYQSVFIEKATPLAFNMTFSPQLSAGSYYVNLYAPDATGAYNANTPLVELPLTITILSGIGEVGEGAEKGITLYSEPSGNLLNIMTSMHVDQAKVYNLAGQLVLNHSLSAMDGGYTLQVNELNAGCYILVLSVGNELYREKFIKK